MQPISKKAIITAGVVGALAIGVALPAIAYATGGDRAIGIVAASLGVDRQQDFAAALAKELGIEQQKVTDALAKLREQREALKPGDHKPADPAERRAKLQEHLAQAVKDGKLTQAEADAVLKAADAGVFGPRGGRLGKLDGRLGPDRPSLDERRGPDGRHGPMRFGKFGGPGTHADFAAALAKELGIEQQKVTDALAKVREQFAPKLHDRKPVDPAKLRGKLQERLAQAVKDGKLTQAEADAVLKVVDARILAGAQKPSS